MVVMNVLRALKTVFTWPSRFESRWVGGNNPDYKATATRTFLLSVLAGIISLCIGLSIKDSRMADYYFKCICFGLSALVFIIVSILEADTWKRNEHAIRWFVCHGCFGIFGGYAVLWAAASIGIPIVTVYLIWKYIWPHLFRAAFPSHGNPGTGAIRGERQTRKSPAEEHEGQETGYGVESQDMFNDELKHKNGLGPDNILVHDESQDSIYGNTYVDENGKEYRVAETDAFGHPTKLEEKWL